MIDSLTAIWKTFSECFLEKSRYLMYLEGLGNTIIIALAACVLGLLIGSLLTFLRLIPKTNPFFYLLGKIADLYVTIIRGTPVVLQLLICYFVIFSFMKSFLGGIPIACITFGLNSGAYTAEILRAGIQSVDPGQMEAGRSLGLSWGLTFRKIIFPQAIKHSIPTLTNEFISLVKETSVAGYVGIVDLTKTQSYVTTQTLEIFMPLLIIAAMYLVVVLLLQALQRSIERRLARSDRG